MAEIVTHASVDAPIPTVWGILTDFERYPDWNPMVVQMIGEPRVGCRLTLHVRVRGRALELPVRVLIATPGEQLCWGGGVRGLLWVEHYVGLSADGGRTRIVHGERFQGVLGSSLHRMVRLESYEAMNQALIQRALLPAEPGAAAEPGVSADPSGVPR